MSLRCCFGIHKWEQSQTRTSSGGFPFNGVLYTTPVRICTRCHRAQYWLPGYGGSKPGCWRATDDETSKWEVILITLIVIAFFVFLCIVPILCFKTPNPPQPIKVEQP